MVLNYSKPQQCNVYSVWIPSTIFGALTCSKIIIAATTISLSDLPQLKCADLVTEVEKDQGSGSEDSEEISDGSGQSVLEQPLILTTRNPEPEPSEYKVTYRHYIA